VDLLAQRYASPFLILDEFIRIHQLYDFVAKILRTIVEEKVHEARWQFYLHKVFDMTFEEYVRRCEKPQHEDQEMSHEQIGNIILDSRKMLDGFIPE
jgi:hypothetical protein